MCVLFTFTVRSCGEQGGGTSGALGAFFLFRSSDLGPGGSVLCVTRAVFGFTVLCCRYTPTGLLPRAALVYMFAYICCVYA